MNIDIENVNLEKIIRNIKKYGKVIVFIKTIRITIYGSNDPYAYAITEFEDIVSELIPLKKPIISKPNPNTLKLDYKPDNQILFIALDSRYQLECDKI